jgi:hypothetical protein
MQQTHIERLRESQSAQAREKCNPSDTHVTHQVHDTAVFVIRDCRDESAVARHREAANAAEMVAEVPVPFACLVEPRAGIDEARASNRGQARFVCCRCRVCVSTRATQRPCIHIDQRRAATFRPPRSSRPCGASRAQTRTGSVWSCVVDTTATRAGMAPPARRGGFTRQPGRIRPQTAGTTVFPAFSHVAKNTRK